MKTTLLLGFILLLTACSDRPANSLATHTETSTQQTETVKSAEKSAAPAQKIAQPGSSAKAGTAVSGYAIYEQKCASCHGHNAEKVALNNSKIIAGWESKRVIQSLKGYQDGTYGGTMKGIMKGQAGSLNAEQIKAVSDYIATL